MIEEIDDIEDLLEGEESQEEQSQETFEHHRFEVDGGQNPLRVDKFIMARLPNASRT